MKDKIKNQLLERESTRNCYKNILMWFVKWVLKMRETQVEKIEKYCIVKKWENVLNTNQLQRKIINTFKQNMLFYR